MPRLAIALLGPPEVTLDGRPVETDRRKALALLAYLAVTGRPHTRDALAALLWPDYDRDSAYAYLRRTLWELNQMLGKGWVEADREQISLPPAPDLWVDTAAFQTTTDSEAVSLYRDDFLAGFVLADTAPFETWQSQQAEHFRRQLARKLEKLAGAHAQLGEYDTALSHARRWLALDTLDETAHRALMRLLAATGDRTSALRQYEACTQTLKAELGIAPQPETTELYQAILRGEVRSSDDGRTSTMGLAAAPPPHPAARMPVLPTPFIGRRAEVEQIKSLLQSPHQHLVTLTGPGGTGKTRLSIQAATELAGNFADGMFFVPLATVQSAELVLQAVAQALDFSFYREGVSPLQQLLDYARDKQLLLILDNFEHLPEAGRLVLDILTQAAGVKIIVTSRVRLNLPGEQLYPVSGMRTPPTAEAETWDDPEAQARPFSAVQLFLDRARRVQPAFELTKDNARSVLEICRLVQGMPLAVELAAAWVELLPPGQIAAEIARSLDFLETDQAGVPDRQRSLRAAFESSWSLLDEGEQTAFLRLCVFVGSFSREAAQAVSGASVRTLLGLANKSWLQPLDNGRFQLHELMRQYGAERLRHDEAAWRDANRQHAEYYADFVVAQHRLMSSTSQVAGLKSLEEDYAGNVKAAWDWLAAERRWGTLIDKMLPGLYQFGTIRDRVEEMIDWLRGPRQMLEAQARPEERLALAVLGTLEAAAEESAQIKDENPIGRLAATWELVAAHQLAEPMGFWFVLLAGVVVARNVDRDARARLDEAMVRIRRQDNRWLLGISLLIQSNIEGDFSYDELKVNEAARIFKELGVLNEQGAIARLRAFYAVRQKRPIAEINRYMDQARQFLEPMGNSLLSSYKMALLAPMYVQQGEIEEMFSSFRQEQQRLEQLGHVRMMASSLQWESLYAARYSTFDHALATRQRALDLAVKVNVQSDLVWQQYELGDIYRIFGRPAVARDYYAQALSGFERMNVVLGLSFYERAQGDLALADSQYTEALAHYQAFLQYALQDNHTWGIGQARAKLALAHAHLQNREQARREMCQSMRQMREWGQDELELFALLTESVCRLQEGRAEQAAELAAFIAHHHVSWNETKQQALALLEAASRQLTEADSRAAVARGQGLDLEQVVDRVLSQ